MRWWALRVGIVLAGAALWFGLLAAGLSLHGCGGDLPPSPAGGCSPYAPEGRCACDGGLPGVEVCAQSDAGGFALACRCRP